MKVIVFDVEHGFCAFIKSPTNYGMMFDCGCTSTFSPALYIAKYELPYCERWNNFALAHMTISHPHKDHIEDIDTVMDKCEPARLKMQDYNWDEIKSEVNAKYEHLDTYTEWTKGYDSSMGKSPDYGIEITRAYLTPDEAKKIDEQKFVNNSSIVTVLNVNGTACSEKFLFGGDMETAGWDALLKKSEKLRMAVKGVDFYITSHHGHSSGFSEELYHAMGTKPILNIVSIHNGDEKIDDRYSKQEYAYGIGPDENKRRCLTTRRDGSIVIEVNSTGRYTVSTEHFDSNR